MIDCFNLSTRHRVKWSVWMTVLEWLYDCISAHATFLYSEVEWLTVFITPPVIKLRGITLWLYIFTPLQYCFIIAMWKNIYMSFHFMYTHTSINTHTHTHTHVCTHNLNTHTVVMCAFLDVFACLCVCVCMYACPHWSCMLTKVYIVCV